jgi:hypothetical protein
MEMKSDAQQIEQQFVMTRNRSGLSGLRDRDLTAGGSRCANHSARVSARFAAVRAWRVTWRLKKIFCHNPLLVNGLWVWRGRAGKKSAKMLLTCGGLPAYLPRPAATVGGRVKRVRPDRFPHGGEGAAGLSSCASKAL